MKSMIIQPNQISIDFKDTDYAKKVGVSVQCATDGRIPQMGIEYTRDCAVQKDMEESIVYTDANKNRDSVVEEVTKNLQTEEFDPADFISQSMTGKDAADIEEDGTLLEQYEAGILERAIERVKTQRHDAEEAVDRQTQKQKEEREFYEEIEKRIEDAAQIAAGINGMSEAAVKYFLDNDMQFTPEDVNSCRAVGTVNTSQPARASFEEMRPQVEAIIEDNGMEVNEETLEAARWLYEQDVPVTGDKIREYQALQELMETPPEQLHDRIVDEVRDGITPERADLLVPSRNEVSERVEKLVQTDEKELAAVFTMEPELITAKRQLEEIRLKMTVDAARVMETKGIRLEISNLVQIVEELRSMEREAAAKALNETGLPADEQNIEITARTMQAGRDILKAPVAVFGQTIATASTDTIEDVAAAGNELRSRQAAESYEAVGTEVRPDLGDSIQKAFANIDDILTELRLPATAANERAVRILSYNRMPLTVENIQSMKEYDDKVTSLARSLKPEVVTELIRRQENPLTMNLDELSEKVTQISDEIMTEDISFRKYIWKLDHSGAITPEERKSMIGIFRLLDKVEKSDGAVVGQVVKDGRQLSFSSLLSAVRSRKAEGIDRQIDDEFGGLKEARVTGERIHEQISAAFGGSVVSKLHKNISPAVLTHKRDTLMEEPLEVLLDECLTSEAAATENAEYYEEAAARIREMAAGSDEQLQQFLRALEMPDSVVNIHMLKSYLEQGSREFLRSYSREESERIVDSFDDPEELMEAYEESDEAHEEKLAQAKGQEDIRYDGIMDIARMANSISFYRQMRRFQKYEVPIVTEQGVTACSVTIREGSEFEKGTVEISVDSERFGSLQATFRVTGDRVSGFVTSDREDTLQVSENIFHEFEKDLEMNGFTMERGDFAKGRRSSFHVGDRSEEAATNQKLYRVAKLFIQNVQRKEEER